MWHRGRWRKEIAAASEEHFMLPNEFLREVNVRGTVASENSGYKGVCFKPMLEEQDICFYEFFPDTVNSEN